MLLCVGSPLITAVPLSSARPQTWAPCSQATIHDTENATKETKTKMLSHKQKTTKCSQVAHIQLQTKPQRYCRNSV